MMINTKIKLHASPAVLFGVLALASGAMPAYAGTGGSPLVQASHVEDTVTDNGNGTFDYGFTVFNDGQFGFLDGGEGDFLEPQIRDWELPYFGDAGIDGIVSPEGWFFEIATIGTANNGVGGTGWDGVAAWQDPNDPFYFGDDSPFTSVTEVIHWYTDNPGDFISTSFERQVNSLSGFGFTADFDQTDAPYQASWAFLPIQSGDPAFPTPFGGIPGSPNALGNPATAVPEPEMLALFAGGLGGLSLAARRKKRKQSTQ